MMAIVQIQAKPTPVMWVSNTTIDTANYVTDESGNILADEAGIQVIIDQ